MTGTAKNKKNNNPVRRKVGVPFVWRALALAAMLPIGLGIFYFGVHRAGVSIPITEKDRDPIFFSFLFAVAIPVFIYSIIKLVMRNILLKKSAGDIAKEVAKDVAAAVAVTAVDALVGSGGERDSRTGSTSSSGTQGGGGDFGGGGASGSY
jgi:uncharacterized membrane protein YgcG